MKLVQLIPDTFQVIRRNILLMVAVSQFCAMPAFAQEAGSANQGMLEASETMTFDTVLDAALANAPAARSEESLRAIADAFESLGNSWLASRPSLQMNYYDDSLMDDIGLREVETGVSFNLWRPGERSDTATLGDDHQARLEAWTEHFRLMVAGQVRAILAEVAAAETAYQIELEATADAERLVGLTESLQEVGDLAQNDVLQARTELLQQRRMELQALTNLTSAERAYTILTGLSIKPANQFSESAVTETRIPQAHPTLRFLQSQVQIAAANVNLSRHQANGRPSVSVGVRRERGSRLQPYNDSLAVSLSVPFGKSPATSASVSLARNAQVDAEVQLVETRRQLDRQLNQLGQELRLMDQSLELGEEQMAITSQRYEMALTAFEVGEMDLTRVVIARQQARQAQRDFESLRLRQRQLSSEYNQTIGVLP